MCVSFRTSSQLSAEVAEIPDVLERQATGTAPALAALVAALRGRARWHVATLARGSSDHAAGYLATLLMQQGVWTSSVPLSQFTLHASPLPGEGVCAVALSQSGQSPDLCRGLDALRSCGALTVAVVNETASPLAGRAQHVLPLAAGPELSVAATKSCVAQFALAARWVAAWCGDRALAEALPTLPALARAALATDWWADTPERERLVAADRLFVLGRGVGLATAQEIALKLKEVCGIQAEACSTAEVRHGPQALLTAGYPVICLATPGPEAAGARTLAAELRTRGVAVWLAGTPASGPVDWPLPAMEEARLAPVPLLVSAYGLVEALARARGRDPDRPPIIEKVTRTE